MDVGADDPWRPAAEWFHGRLDERGVAHEWGVLDGAGHGAGDPGYWSRHAPEWVRY